MSLEAKKGVGIEAMDAVADLGGGGSKVAIAPPPPIGYGYILDKT